MTIAVQTVVHHVSTTGYDPAADAARAAWATFDATLGAALAATLLSALLVFGAFYLPHRQRRDRLRSATMELGYALAGVAYLKLYLDRLERESPMVMQEGLDKTEGAVLALQQMFATAPDDVDVVKFALNLQTSIMLFRAFIQHNLARGPRAKAGSIADFYNILFSEMEARYVEYDRLRQRYGVPKFAEYMNELGPSFPTDAPISPRSL